MTAYDMAKEEFESEHAYDELEHGCGWGIHQYAWDEHYGYITRLLEAVEDAGSWTDYVRRVREPSAKLWALRYLCLAGRASAPENLTRLFGSPLPEAAAGAAASTSPTSMSKIPLVSWVFQWARTRSRRRALSAARTTPPDEVFAHVLSFWEESVL